MKRHAYWMDSRIAYGKIAGQNKMKYMEGRNENLKCSRKGKL